MHEEFVEREGWITDDEFAHALSVCAMLPGPEAQQLITYIGWRRRGVVGGLLAGSLFVVPGFLALLLLSLAYVTWTDTDFLQNMVASVGPAVIVVIAVSVKRLAKRTLSTPLLVNLTVATFILLFATRIPLPVVLIGAFVVGFLSQRTPASSIEPPLTPHVSRLNLRAVIALVALWPVPVLLSLLFVEPGHAIVDTARFFSVTAVTTFGGAYAILSYVADQAVTNHGWLTQRDMVAGLAMAETTPGPLIMVVQFVGFMAAYSAPGDLSPIVAGVIASVVVTWVTFIPSLAVILTAAPRVERLRQSPRFQRASAGSIAVAIGGIIDLGLTFSSHVLFDDHTAFSSSLFSSEIPRMSTLNVGAFALLLVAGILVLKTQWTTTRVMAACLVLGLVGHPVTAMF